MPEQDFNTPMMKQYTDIKGQYPDCLLFFRLGDFYELFMDDAKIGAGVLDITLTSRDRGKDGRIPMAGVPFHAVDSYLAKLVKAGYKVAICEQLTEPDGTGLVERGVVRIVTPGTILDENSLEKRENNYVMSISHNDEVLGIAFADISTGYFQVSEFNLNEQNFEQTVIDEISRMMPTECILPIHLYDQPKLLRTLKTNKNLNIYMFSDWVEYAQQGEKFLKDHFKVKTLAGFGIEDKNHAIKAASGLLGYLKTTQKNKIQHIQNITSSNVGSQLELDRSTILNLEIFSTIREGNRKGSLIHHIDRTSTPMGGRLLRQWILKPLFNKQEILDRYDAVSELIFKRIVREQIKEVLVSLTDFERLLSRLSVGVGNARDVVNLKQSLQSVLKIKGYLADIDSALIKNLSAKMMDELNETVNLISQVITDEPPIDLKIGGLIKVGVSEELDLLKDSIKGSKDWVNNLEQKERERTGINSLKVKYNQVFGYYIEITKSNLESVPEDYYRKQTLVNAERFITPELKHHEEIILSAEEKIKDLEYKLFLDYVTKILLSTPLIQDAAKSISALDCLINFADLAESENYCRPEIIETGEIIIKDGRHPVVEKLLEESTFVPNDVDLNTSDKQLLIITGPNMSGKSVYIRQTALLVLMAQIGSFVPATTAQISLVDKIFVRSGASDVITSGLSTFMVEMVETANILNHATTKSLIVMDEIGRGTSTYDGVSIAWAVAEFLITNTKMSPKTLFATHYHELQKIEADYPNKAKNFQVSAIEKNGELNFLHKVMSGGSSHSYGIAVAKLAGVPKEVTQKALQILQLLESKSNTKFDFEEWLDGTSHDKNLDNSNNIVKMLNEVDIDKLTPIEAISKLNELKTMLKKTAL